MMLMTEQRVLPETDRDRLKAAFSELRRRGYGARMNFMCCGSCAGYAMGQKHDDKKGVVYYSRQGESSFYTGDYYRRGEKTDWLQESLYLSWSGDGYEIAAVLRDFGLTVAWQESESYCIEVLPRDMEDRCE